MSLTKTLACSARKGLNVSVLRCATGLVSSSAQETSPVSGFSSFGTGFCNHDTIPGEKIRFIGCS